jgi:hypothetical protein
VIANFFATTFSRSDRDRTRCRKLFIHDHDPSHLRVQTILTSTDIRSHSNRIKKSFSIDAKSEILSAANSFAKTHNLLTLEICSPYVWRNRYDAHRARTQLLGADSDLGKCGWTNESLSRCEENFAVVKRQKILTACAAHCRSS